jgi:hypothetical protein
MTMTYDENVIVTFAERLYRGQPRRARSRKRIGPWQMRTRVRSSERRNRARAPAWLASPRCEPRTVSSTTSEFSSFQLTTLNYLTYRAYSTVARSHPM